MRRLRYVPVLECLVHLLAVGLRGLVVQLDRAGFLREHAADEAVDCGCASDSLVVEQNRVDRREVGAFDVEAPRVEE